MAFNLVDTPAHIKAKADEAIRISGLRSLVAAIIEQAIVDYESLVISGKIDRNGKINRAAFKNRNRRRHKTAGGYMYPHEVEGLILFFRENGDMDQTLEYASLNVSGNAIRRGLELMRQRQQPLEAACC